MSLQLEMIIVSLDKVLYATYFSPSHIDKKRGFVSLFNGISTFVGYLMPKSPL